MFISYRSPLLTAVALGSACALPLRWLAFFLKYWDCELFQVLEDFQTDRMVRVLAPISFCAVSTALFFAYLWFFFGIPGATEVCAAWDKAGKQFFAMIFSFGLADINGSVGFGAFILASIYGSAWSRGELAKLLRLNDKMSTKQHQNLFFGGLVLLIGMVYGMVVSYRTLDIVSMYHIVGSVLISFLSMILDIIVHVVYLFDPNEFEMSVGSYRFFRIAESVVNILELSVSLFFIGRLLIESELPIFHMRQLIDNVNGFYNQYGLFHGWMKKRYMIGHLQMASESDMERDDMCAICRLEMRISSGRKLPCNHCFHTECIERWIDHQLRCPTCRQDVKALLDEAERILKGETDARPVGAGDQKIIRFSDLME
jgi:hypothetical protein